jgi:hypothetical protein
MILSTKDQTTFFHNYLPLMFYASVYEGLLPQKSKLAEFVNVPLNVKAMGRDVLFNDQDVLNYYLADNKHRLDDRATEFVQNVAGGLLSEFVILKQEKRFAVFLDVNTQVYYHVIGVTEPFDEMLPELPVKVKTAIFNFDDKIVCDGLIVGAQTAVAPALAATLLENYSDALSAETVQAYIE